MKMTAVSPPSVGMTTIYVEHHNERIKWDVSTIYSRANEKSPDIDSVRIFQEINDYWASLSTEMQDGIFETYQQIRKIFDGDYDLEVVNAKLRNKVGVLYQYMALPKISQWLKSNVVLRYPTSVKPRLDGTEIAQRTYVHEDYFGLVALGTALRPMIPIWGEFIARARSKKQVGSANKELRAFGLLFNTQLIRSPEVNRLREFIAHSIHPATSGNKSFTTVMSGLSTAEQPDWFLSLACIRRLAVLEIQGTTPNYNIVATIFRFVESKVQSMDRDHGRAFNGRIGDKRQTGGSADDNNASIVESYKIKPIITKGTEVTFNVFASRLEPMAIAREPELDLKCLEECRRSLKKFTYEDIRESQKWLVRWALDPVLNPRCVDLLTIQPLLNAMAAAQAVLWHWGFYDLAALVTATPVMANTDIIAGATDNRSRISKEHILRLQVPYPHYSQARRSSVNVRNTNVAVLAIDRLAEILYANDWRFNCPDALLEKTSRRGNTRIMIAPPDLKRQLAELVLHPKFGKQQKREL